MRLLGSLFLAVLVSSQTTNIPPDPLQEVVRGLELDRYKAHIKGLAQFGDRLQGTQRNRAAIDWIEKQLRSFGYTDVVRHRFISSSGPLENIYGAPRGVNGACDMQRSPP